MRLGTSIRLVSDAIRLTGSNTSTKSAAETPTAAMGSWSRLSGVSSNLLKPQRIIPRPASAGNEHQNIAHKEIGSFARRDTYATEIPIILPPMILPILKMLQP